MISAGRLVSFYAETPIHCGSGSTFDAIDLPVQREKHTGLPLLPSSSLKGVWRDVARGKYPNDRTIEDVFGPEDDGGLHSGAISPTDGRLLLFPVRASEGVFAWVTCPFVLRRLVRDAALMPGVPAALAGLSVTDPTDDEAFIDASAGPGGEVLLEDDCFTRRPIQGLTVEAAVAALLPPKTTVPEYAFIHDRLKKHLVVISDNQFARLTTAHTDVVTRNRLNTRKTTTGDGGNMWIQEYVPSDSLFYSAVLAMPSRREHSVLDSGAKILTEMQRLTDVSHFQVGGDETVGRGWVRMTWVEA